MCVCTLSLHTQVVCTVSKVYFNIPDDESATGFEIAVEGTLRIVKEVRMRVGRVLGVRVGECVVRAGGVLGLRVWECVVRVGGVLRKRVGECVVRVGECVVRVGGVCGEGGGVCDEGGRSVW